MTVRRYLPFLLLSLPLLVACANRIAPEIEPTPTVAPTPAPTPTPSPVLGAGFRFSTYGPAYDPGVAYWLSLGESMAEKFPTAEPEAIWIVGDFAGRGPLLTFPGTHEDFNIHYSMEDNNEEALTMFDEAGMRVWLQVEPGSVEMLDLIDVVLERYKHHPSVIGFGVDVEWYHSDGTPGGRAITDEEATAWVAAVRAHNPDYRLFLKHWERKQMPPTARDGIVFVDDSQMFESMEQMIEEFKVWGEHFAPAAVAFQYGYPADEKWWGELSDPPGEIGRAILENVPNTEGLYWVDFTAFQMFPPPE